MAETEEYFPRGGKKTTEVQFKPGVNFLGAITKSDKKKKRPKKAEADDGYLSDEARKDVDTSYNKCAVGISYVTVKPGLLMLGRVHSVRDTKVLVSLPGKMFGAVMACHVSEAYNKVLEAYVNDKQDSVVELPAMFKPGQYVAVKVLEVDDGHRLLLSMMPNHINEGKHHGDLKIGCIVQSAVSSVEDHGYVMDIGIPGTRAFLPSTNTNPELQLDTGTVTWCAVKSVTPSADTCIVTLSSDQSSLQKTVLRSKPSSGLLPGTLVEFHVDKSLENGIEGRVFDQTAYIPRYQVDLVHGKKPAIGKTIRARVLYTMPTSNCPFLTLKKVMDSAHPDLSEEQKLQEGEIVEEAQVIKITGRSIHFRLGGGCAGTMSVKRLHVDEDLTDEEVVAKTYPLGSKHKVRVLNYNLSDYVYSVSDEVSVVNESYFSLADLRLGALVSGEICSTDNDHVVVRIGRLTGLVPNSHLFDSGVYVDPKKGPTKKFSKKFKIGQKVSARVLSVDDEKQQLYLTLKPSLLDPDMEILTSVDQAEIGKAYTGVIKYVKDYVLVAFFNKVMAYVPRNFVTTTPLDNLMEAFHVGQIVKCTIMKKDPNATRMLGSLITEPFWPAPRPPNKNKRKLNTENDSEPKKKRKASENQEDTRQVKSEDEEVNKKDSKKKKRKKHSISENSDQEVEEEKRGTKKKSNKKESVSDDTERDSKKRKKQIDKVDKSEIANQESNKKGKKKKDQIKNLDNETIETSKKDCKKKKKDKQKEVSEQSDAIETDMSDSELIENQGTNKKGKKKKNQSENSDNETKETSKKDCKKKKKDKQKEVSEQSDAIETDMSDSDQLLTAQDLFLTDLTDCTTPKELKKRIVSLVKAVKTRSHKIERIEKKIDAIECKGLNTYNQMYHRAMHTDKIVLEERLKKLLLVLKEAQDKLKEMGGKKDEDYKQKQKQNKKKKDTTQPNTEVPQEAKEEKLPEEVQKKLKEKSKSIKVVESLEPALEVPSAKEFWSASADTLGKNVPEESSSSDEEEQEQPKKKRKKLTVAEKLAKAREEEERVREMERRAIESESQPRSSDQFERALLANPNCSQLWIAYMAFHLQATEIEKARAVGRKALSTIGFREEQERLNVWIALLNCEHRFGTKESQQKTLEDAVQMNEPYQVHSKLLDILVDTGKTSELSSLVDLMMRKYKREPKTYVACGEACYKAGMVDKARQVMQKAVAVLEKKEHVSVLVQFALMESRTGARERAEALFEQVVAVYPHRVDVCAVYADMLAKHGDIQQVRQVMERMTSQKLPARKMKVLYRKWGELEERLGDQEHVEEVRQRAAKFIEKAQF